MAPKKETPREEALRKGAEVDAEIEEMRRQVEAAPARHRAEDAQRTAEQVDDGLYGVTSVQEKTAVEQAKAAGNNDVLEALKQQLGAIEDVPTWMPAYLNRPVTSDDIPKLREAWEAMTGETLASDEEVLTKLTAPNELTQLVASTAFSEEEVLELTFDLGPGYNNQKARMPLEQADAMRSVNPRTAGQLRLLVPAATKNKLHPALLAAAADLEPTSLFSSGAVMDDENRRGMEKMDGTSYAPSAMRRRGFQRVASELAQFKAMGYDDTLALVASVDPGLAGTIKNAPRSLTGEQRSKLRTILTQAKWDTETLAAQGLYVDQAKLDFVTGLSDPEGAAPITVNLPDPDAVKQSVQTLFRAWFQREPTEGEEASFVASINNAVIAEETSAYQAGLDVSNPYSDTAGGVRTIVRTQVDPQATMEQGLRATGEYKQLFGQKPGNLSEEEYASVHSGAAQRMFGAEGAGQGQAIRAGMETGSTQTTIGTLAGSYDATKNSTFMERMARTAQTIAEMT